ncbi:hypothetical protein PFDG_00277, partial [Plasmodium falciparum Dd2]
TFKQRQCRPAMLPRRGRNLPNFVPLQDKRLSHEQRQPPPSQKKEYNNYKMGICKRY